MRNDTYARVRDLGRIFLYTITFRFVFYIIKHTLILFWKILRFGFIYIFAYALLGVLLHLFFDFEFNLWEMGSALYLSGFIFWCCITLIVVVKNIRKKISVAKLKRAEECYKSYKINEQKCYMLWVQECEKQKKKEQARCKLHEKKCKKEQRWKNLESFFFKE